MKGIPNFKGLYAITRDGRVWSYPKKWERKGTSPASHKGKWMKSYLVTGYPALTLRDAQNKKCKLLVHRLIALTYIPVPALQVNHINGIRTDNRIKNLEWLTGTENTRHAQGLPWVGHPRGEKTNGSKLKEKQVLEIRGYAKNRTYTYQGMAKMYKVDSSAISRVVNRQTWTHI